MLKNIWAKLQNACEDTQNVWHLPVLGTVSRGRPKLRVMVLRAVEPQARAVVCYSDIRADKVQNIMGHPQVEWLFYDANEAVQLRASGKTVVHNRNAVTEAAWRRKSAINHLHYISPLPPGTSLPASLPRDLPDLKESELAYHNFAVAVTTVQVFELLILGETKDKRASFTWDGEKFAALWMVP